MGQKASVGDVFLIPIDEARFGIGQVAGDWKGELYIIVYDIVYGAVHADPESVLRAKPLLAALSLDAKIHNDDWRVIGNVTENLNDIPQPFFKVNQNGCEYLESRDRTISRPVSYVEAAELKLRTVVAPVRLENALKAHQGIGEWNTKYDDLRSDYVMRSSKLALHR